MTLLLEAGAELLTELAARSNAREGLGLPAPLAPGSRHLGLVVLYDSRGRDPVASDDALPDESLVFVAWDLGTTVALLALTAAELRALPPVEADLDVAQRLHVAGEELLLAE